MFRKAAFLVSFSVFAMNSAVAVALAQDLNTVLMNSTFEIMGPSAEAGKTTFGTIFVLGKPLKADPTKGSYVLITAAHVLNEISGDTATLFLRKKDASGAFTKFPVPLSIRNQGKNLYVKNPDADVAAMYLNLPNETEIKLLPLALLADDATLQHLEVHPGDELLCLGFPLAIDVKGFPVIRSGLLASYPITPSRIVKQYYYNFHVFPGNGCATWEVAYGQFSFSAACF